MEKYDSRPSRFLSVSRQEIIRARGQRRAMPLRFNRALHSDCVHGVGQVPVLISQQPPSSLVWKTYPSTIPTLRVDDIAEVLVSAACKAGGPGW
jgi:hypothetical protein